MKIILNKLLLLSTVAIILTSCSKEKYVEPLDKDSVPANVTNVTVEPLPGAARISYELPLDKNLRYVKAVYEIRPGVEKESISSLYANSLIVDGFADEKEYQVKLYSVSKGEQMSETPVIVNLTPLTSPIKEAFNTLAFKETFGGATLSFDNSGAAALSVKILTDSSGRLREVETYYTNAVQGKYSIRGFASEPRLFAAVVRDRWGNISDTITQMLTPIFEQAIPKGNFRHVPLSNDTYEPHSTPVWNVTKLWDGKLQGDDQYSIFHTKPGSGMPQSFTFDMGVTAILSRYKFWHAGAGAYQRGAPKKWEVWGTDTAPDPLGNWEGWTKLMDSESYKPSGEGPITSGDLNYANVQGEEFDFPEGIPAVRYLRFKTTETWGGLDYVYIGELSFWGKIQ